MENSTSSVRKFFSSSSNDDERTKDDTIEESTWTMYFEDFLANNNINQDNKNGSFCHDDHVESCTSLVSDAASLVVKRSADDNKPAAVGLSNIKSYNRLSFKKRKTKEALFDDALEDTATSPVNSPKVCDVMNQFNGKKKEKDNMDISQEKGSATSNNENERSDLGFLETESDFSELKRRGLCLVPLSTVVNYLG